MAWGSHQGRVKLLREERLGRRSAVPGGAAYGCLAMPRWASNGLQLLLTERLRLGRTVLRQILELRLGVAALGPPCLDWAAAQLQWAGAEHLRTALPAAAARLLQSGFAVLLSGMHCSDTGTSQHGRPHGDPPVPDCAQTAQMSEAWECFLQDPARIGDRTPQLPEAAG